MGRPTGRPAGRPPNLTTVTAIGDYKAELETLLHRLAKAIDACPGHGMAALSREYRETAKELHALTGEDDPDDPIARIVANGAARAKGLEVSKLSAD